MFKRKNKIFGLTKILKLLIYQTYDRYKYIFYYNTIAAVYYNYLI